MSVGPRRSMVLVVFLGLVVAFSSTGAAKTELPRRGLPSRTLFSQAQVADGTEEGWSYPYIALRDPVKNLVRIYGQYSVKVIGNDSNIGEVTQFAGCVMRGNGKEEVVRNVEPIIQLMRWDDNFTETVMHTANYIIDCHNPGHWAKTVQIRIHNGHDLGRVLDITEMSGERKGRLGVCTQPLFTHRAWLRDWVNYQFLIGADEVIMQTPQGAHIDDLFNSNRDKRLNFNSQLAERSPEVTGKQPMVRFNQPNVTWQDYWPSPAASYYGEMFMFSACHYRLRYAYDYTIQFDIDEFWTAAKDTKEKLLPDFLDKHMLEEYATVGFYQLLYPLNCPTRSTGEYTTRFTLRHPGDGQVKPAMRPQYVLNAHVHWLLDTSPEYKEKYGFEMKHKDFSTEVAFLKHIRPMTWTGEDGKLMTEECFFGRESDALGYHLLVQD